MDPDWTQFKSDWVNSNLILLELKIILLQYHLSNQEPIIIKEIQDWISEFDYLNHKINRQSVQVADFKNRLIIWATKTSDRLMRVEDREREPKTRGAWTHINYCYGDSTLL